MILSYVNCKFFNVNIFNLTYLLDHYNSRYLVLNKLYNYTEFICIVIFQFLILISIANIFSL